MSGKRGRPSQYTLDSIAQAALGVIRNRGPDALSLRSVADALGTTHVTILRHCGTFDGLLDVCAEHAAAQYPKIPQSADWKRTTQAYFEAAYDMWSEHADLILLMRGRVWHGLNITRRFYEPGMRSIVDGGLPVFEAAALFSILYRQTIGSIVATRANQWSPWESREALKRHGIQDFPTLARVEQERDARDARDERRSYCDALQRIIAEFSQTEMPDQID